MSAWASGWETPQPKHRRLLAWCWSTWESRFPSQTPTSFCPKTVSSPRASRRGLSVHCGCAFTRAWRSNLRAFSPTLSFPWFPFSETWRPWGSRVTPENFRRLVRSSPHRVPPIRRTRSPQLGEKSILAHPNSFRPCCLRTSRCPRLVPPRLVTPLMQRHSRISNNPTPTRFSMRSWLIATPPSSTKSWRVSLALLPTMDVSTPRSTKRGRAPEGSHPQNQTCRTFRFAQRWGTRFGQPSCRRRTLMVC